MIFRGFGLGKSIDVKWVHRAAEPPCRATLVWAEHGGAMIVVHAPGDLGRVLGELYPAWHHHPYTVLREWDLPGRGGVCGTRAGYARHMRAGGHACGPCRAANAAYNRAWRARRATTNTEETS